MSHFYRQKSYSFNETDEMLTEIKKEMSNFITKEEAELIWNRRFAIVDPPPYWHDNRRVEELLMRIDMLNHQVIELKCELESIKNEKSSKYKELDEPTM
jgi:hypothetical protein